MRYIKKGNSPDFFEQEKINLKDDPAWKNLHCKKELRSYLIVEQKELCAYCERKIDDENSHIEHIFPQTKKYPALRFDYQNLIASCNGDMCNPELKEEFYPENVDSCGHKKDNDIDPELFLNPVTVQDIDKHLSYIKETGFIFAGEKDSQKADYTIRLLNLDNPRLNNERHHASNNLWKAIEKIPKSQRKNKMIQLLAKERSFISFLRFYYASFL